MTITTIAASNNDISSSNNSDSTWDPASKSCTAVLLESAKSASGRFGADCRTRLRSIIEGKGTSIPRVEPIKEYQRKTRDYSTRWQPTEITGPTSHRKVHQIDGQEGAYHLAWAHGIHLDNGKMRLHSTGEPYQMMCRRLLNCSSRMAYSQNSCGVVINHSPQFAFFPSILKFCTLLKALRSFRHKNSHHIVVLRIDMAPRTEKRKSLFCLRRKKWQPWPPWPPSSLVTPATATQHSRDMSMLSLPDGLVVSLWIDLSTYMCRRWPWTSRM